MAENINTPIGELNWVFINGSFKKDLNGNDRYVASLYLHKDSDEFKAVETKITEFWADNKPKGAKCKSNGIKVVMEKDGGKTGDDGEPLYVETDMRSINFWTSPTYPDGSEKIIKTYNAKANEISLGSKKIGNGSRGAISGAMAIYDQGVASRGVTLYLNAIQLTKFEEFTGGDAGFAASNEEGGFEGFAEEADGFTSTEGEAKPRL